MREDFQILGYQMYHLWSIIMRKHNQDSVPLPGSLQTVWQCRQCQEGLSGRRRRWWRRWWRWSIRAGGRRSSSASSSLINRTPITHRNGSVASAISSCCYQESEQLIVQPDELGHVMIVNFSDDRESFTLFFVNLVGQVLHWDRRDIRLICNNCLFSPIWKCNQCNSNSKPDIGR